MSLVARIKHAGTVGISDHLENLTDGRFEHYRKEIRTEGLKLGTEVDEYYWAKRRGIMPWTNTSTTANTAAPIKEVSKRCLQPANR